MKWETAITHIKDGKELVRGYDLKDIILNKSFPEAIFLVLRGEFPNEREARMLNALCTAAIDHGIGVSSAMTARTVVSTGNSMHTAIAAGILSMGTLHGSAIEDAARFFLEHVGETDVAELVGRLKEAQIKVPGYGHKLLDRDPRSEALFEIAKKTEFYGKHCVFAELIHKALNATVSKEIPLNVDGAMGAILLDMGFDWRFAKGLFIIGRVPGLVAHIFEEMASQNGLRRLEEREAEYIGPNERKI